MKRNDRGHSCSPRAEIPDDSDVIYVGKRQDPPKTLPNYKATTQPDMEHTIGVGKPGQAPAIETAVTRDRAPGNDKGLSHSRKARISNDDFDGDSDVIQVKEERRSSKDYHDYIRSLNFR